jgi:hypothetical protein
MAMKRGHRFEVPFEVAFPKGLVLLGEISANVKYNPDPRAVPEQKFDWDPKTETGTGLPEWKATVTDPDEDKAKRASFEVVFLGQHVPVPVTAELVANTGMRMVELEGLTAEPVVSGQGEFKYQGWKFRATGIKGDTNTPKANGRNGSDAKAGA